MFQLRWIDSVKAIGKAMGAAERGPVRAADQAWRMNGFPRPGCRRDSLLCTARGENVLELWEAGVGQPRDQAAGTTWEPARGTWQAQEVASGMLCGVGVAGGASVAESGENVSTSLSDILLGSSWGVGSPSAP